MACAPSPNAAEATPFACALLPNAVAGLKPKLSPLASALVPKAMSSPKTALAPLPKAVAPPPSALVPTPIAVALRPLAKLFCPKAIAPAPPVALAFWPMAIPDGAAADTLDSAPMATELAASDWAPRTSFAPIATEPSPDARVTSAGFLDVVEPIDVELFAVACAPLPIAVVNAPLAADACPKAMAAVADALASRPMANELNPEATAARPMATVVAPDALAPFPIATELEPCAAVRTVPAEVPIATPPLPARGPVPVNASARLEPMAILLPSALPPPLAYSAWTTLLPANPPATRISAIVACVKAPIDRPSPFPMPPEDASRAAAATTVLLLFDGLPRAEESSDAATQAPSGSFQIV